MNGMKSSDRNSGFSFFVELTPQLVGFDRPLSIFDANGPNKVADEVWTWVVRSSVETQFAVSRRMDDFSYKSNRFTGKSKYEKIQLKGR